MSNKKNDAIKRPTRDDFANFVTGLSGPPDKSQYGYYQRFPTLWEVELSNMYEQNAIAARIVDRLVDDATREGFLLSGSDKQFDFASLQSEIEDYDLPKIINKAWKQARLYGGALIIMAVNDGKKYDEPLDKDNLTNIIGFRVVNAFRARPDSFNYGLGASSYLNPEYYLIQEVNGKQKKIHRSRCIRLEGISDLSDRRKIEINNGWGPSILQRVYREISNLGQAEGYLSSIMHECSVLGIQIEGLDEQLCGGDDSRSAIQAKLESIKMLMDNLHILAMDKKDLFMEQKRDVSGLDKIIQVFIEAVVRATDYPRLIILGEQPGGLNNSADGEIRGYYDWVSSQQKNVLTPIMNQLLELIFKVREHKNLNVPNEWNIEYVPLWQPSQNEEADVFLKTMQASQIATLAGYMTVDEVRARLISMGIIEESLNKPQGVQLGQIQSPEVIKATEEIEVAQDQEAMASTDPVPPDLCSTKEAAQMIGVPTNTINNMCNRGELRYWQFGSRKQVSMADVMKAGRRDSVRKALVKYDVIGQGQIGIMMPIPQWFIEQNNLPPLQDDIPHHITFLVIKDIKGRHEDFKKIVSEFVSEIGLIEANIEGTRKLGKALVGDADFSKDMHLVRRMLIKTLELAGFEVDKRFPEWEPHMTLQYMTDPETGNVFDNFQLKGDITIPEMQIWGLSLGPIPLPLGA